MTADGSGSPQRADVLAAGLASRCERIEDSLKVLHKKMDRLVEDGAVARTEIAWLKWGMRVLFAAVLGVGGVAAQGVL